VYGPFVNGSCAGDMPGLWHTRMVAAWVKAWESDLVEQVDDHGDGLYTVPSQTKAETWYAVHRYTLEPDGYLYLCDCPASEKGGVVCAHAMAVYLWRLRHKMRWRLKHPEKGA
jgi:hypothetical protein